MPLTPEQFRRADALFGECVQLSTDQHDAFLAERCLDDPDVRDFVKSMLAHDAAPALPPTEAVNRDLRRLAHSAISTSNEFTQVDEYRLLEKLGEGGFGTVYLAEQEQPVRRRVALKIIKLGMDTRQVVARFEAERQALAMMDHPGIAKVFDAGATSTGRPYFVMELVRGPAITTYCDDRRLPTRERVELFIEVCRAVQHAHHKGVIHRDLKPSNILVTEQDGRPVPKIIDFGVAKAIAQPLTDSSVHTRQHQIIGTPAYMSPEQAESSGLDIDARTDVYSLGVVLYELLAGTVPFDRSSLSDPGDNALFRAIREQEPARPSARLATLASRGATDAGAAETIISAPLGSQRDPADVPPNSGGSRGATLVARIADRRRTDSATLRRQLRGELDWITLRAMEKDRTRRYETPAALAGDLERYLRHETVLAGPPTPTYRLRKFVRRNRALIAVSAVVLCALVVGLVTATWGFIIARQQRDLASSEAAKALAANQFLQDLFASINPANARGREITVREVFDQADRKIAYGKLREQPEVEASVRFTLGQSYRAIGHIKEAEKQLRAALVLRERVLGPDHITTLDTAAQLGSLIATWGDPAEGGMMMRDALARRERLGIATDETSATLMIEMGRISSDPDRRESLIRRGFELRKRLLPSDHADIGHALIELAFVAAARKDFDEAIRLNREALEIHRKAFGSPHPQVAGTLYCLAELLLDAKRAEEAVPAYREAADIYHRVFSENLASEARALNAMGVALMSLRQLTQAEEAFRAAIACEPRSLPDGPDLFATFRGNLGDCLRMLKRYDEAEPLLLASMATYQTAGDSDDDLRLARQRLFFLYRESGQPEKAAQFATTQPAAR